MKLPASRILCIAVMVLSKHTLCLNPPPNNNPAPAASNPAPSNNLLAANEAKPVGVSPANGQTVGGPPNINNVNGVPSENNNPNGNGLKQNNNGLQTGAPNNLPNSGVNNGAPNSNNGATNNQGSPGNGMLLNGANNNQGNTSTGTVPGNGINGQNSVGNNVTRPGVGNDNHHPIGKSAKQTQNHTGQKGKSDVHRGQKSNGNSVYGIKSGIWWRSIQMLVAIVVPLLIKHTI